MQPLHPGSKVSAGSSIEAIARKAGGRVLASGQDIVGFAGRLKDRSGISEAPLKTYAIAGLQCGVTRCMRTGADWRKGRA